MSSFQFKEPTAKRNPKDIPNSPFPLSSFLQTDANRKYLIGGRHYLGYLETNGVKIQDVENITSIYYMGYFGKSTFSRSTPHHQISRTKEDGFIPVDVIPPSPNVPANAKAFHWESTDDGCQEGEAEPPETLQLMFEEAYFLSYALGCLVVKKYGMALNLLQLWNECCSLTSYDKFPVTYAAYHHFRSKGWVVRSGSKFGADFLLYKDGPAFYHASYSVIVKKTQTGDHDSRIETWKDLSAFNRVTESVGKEVLLCFVIVPSLSPTDLKSPNCIKEFEIKEVIARRWVTSEQRMQESDNT